MSRLVDELRARGQRVTVARRAVLEELVAAGEDHLSADELAERIGARVPAVHLSTVYRTLEALCEAGMITPARLADHPATYHLTSDVHHHAVCTGCGAVLRVPDEVLAPVHRRLWRDHGFEAGPRHLTITGRCSACLAAQD